MATLRDNVARGVRWGLYYGAAYSLYVVVLVAVRGVEVLEEHDVSLVGVIALYFTGGILGGAIAGALLPYGQRPVGAMVVGFFAAIPVLVMAGMLMLPSDEWLTTLPPVALGVAALLGPLSGLGLWYVNRS